MGCTGGAESGIGGNWNSTRSKVADDAGGGGGGSGPSTLSHGFGNTWAAESGRTVRPFSTANLIVLDLPILGELSSCCRGSRSSSALLGLIKGRGGRASAVISPVLSPKRRSEGEDARLTGPACRMNGGGLHRSVVSTVETAVSEEACESRGTDLILSSCTTLKDFARGF